MCIFSIKIAQHKGKGAFKPCHQNHGCSPSLYEEIAKVPPYQKERILSLFARLSVKILFFVYLCIILYKYYNLYDKDFYNTNSIAC